MGIREMTELLFPGCVSHVEKWRVTAFWRTSQHLTQELSPRFPEDKFNTRRMFIKQSWTAGKNKPCRRWQVWKELPTKGKEVVTSVKEKAGDRGSAPSQFSSTWSALFTRHFCSERESGYKIWYKPSLGEPGLRPFRDVTMQTLCPQIVSSVRTIEKKTTTLRPLKMKRNHWENKRLKCSNKNIKNNQLKHTVQFWPVESTALQLRTSVLSLWSQTFSGLQVAACEQERWREIILETRRQEKYEMEPGGEKQPFKGEWRQLCSQSSAVWPHGLQPTSFLFVTPWTVAHQAPLSKNTAVVAIPFSRGSSGPRAQTYISWVLYHYHHLGSSWRQLVLNWITEDEFGSIWRDFWKKRTLL